MTATSCLYCTRLGRMPCVPGHLLGLENDMFRVGEQTNETTTEARASVNVKGMTTVLGGGLLLVIVAFTLIVLLT